MSFEVPGASRIGPALLWSGHPTVIIVRFLRDNPARRVSFADICVATVARPRAGRASERRLPFAGDSLSNLPASRIQGNSGQNVRTEWQDRGERARAGGSPGLAHE